MIERLITSEIEKWIDSDQYIIIKGARRVGKTTVMQDIFQKTKEKKAFLVCDNLDFLEKVSTPDDLIFYIQEVFQFRKEEPFVLFLDEFQYLHDAGLFLKNLYDTYSHLKIIASGSSSLEITKNTEFLTGRSIEFLLEPLSFSEFASFHLQKQISPVVVSDIHQLEKIYKLYKRDLERLFLEYLHFGGYPQIVLEESREKKSTLLKNYIVKYLEKDIVHLLHVENITAFNALLKLLASQIGSLLNVHEISNTLNISNATAKKYLDIIEGTYVVRRIFPYFQNIRSELSKMPKLYFLDLGIRNEILGNAASVDVSFQIGEKVENFVCNALKNYYSEKKVNFYRTISGSEIDFLIDSPHEKILFEVKYRSKVKPPLSFKNFAKKYSEQKTTQIILTKDILKMEDEILFLPVVLLPFVSFP